jgi:hypothetical protein
MPLSGISNHDQGPLTGDKTMLTPLGRAGEVTRQIRIKERFERVALESNLMVGIDRIDGQPSELEMDRLAQFLDNVLANAIWKRLDRVGTSFAMDVTAVGPEYRARAVPACPVPRGRRDIRRALRARRAPPHRDRCALGPATPGDPYD